jgi:CHAD domain-containing protein
VAGARKVELDCEATFGDAAVRAVAVRANEVFEHSAGVLDLAQVERVHDMRVATRRLRAALEIFEPCFPAKKHRKALKRVKRLADALGGRRDLDVEVALLEGLLDEIDEADRAALRDLIEERRKCQRQANERLEPHLEPKRLKKLRRRLKKLTKAAIT